MSFFHFFSSKSKTPFPFHLLKTDVHSHLIPGLDDGAPDEATSIALIRGMLDLGLEQFTGTPHVMEDIWKNDTGTIMAGHKRLMHALHAEGVDKQVRPAAEYLIDGHFEQLLEEKTPLLTIRDNLVLVEISFVQPPMQFKEILFELQMQGYQPVLAHPERYAYYHFNKAELESIKNTGCLFQANLLSFSGYYGPEILQFAERMAKYGMIDLLGTDLHHERHLNALRDLRFTRALQQVLDKITC